MKTELPKPTLTQRCASLSTAQLMSVGHGLYHHTDKGSEEAMTAILDTLEARLSTVEFVAYCDALGTVAA